MAGGMDSGRRGGYGSMAERVARQRGATTPSPRRTRFCWVLHDDRGSVGPWPGLLVEWRRDEAGWRARVAYVPDERLVEEWLPETRLRPGDWTS